jgi:cytochrome c oxidase cbb3-type subunit 4
MELYSTLSSLFTVISFLVFLGIVAWAYGRRRQGAFAEAANEPFALPDENGAAAAPFGRGDRVDRARER